LALSNFFWAKILAKKKGRVNPAQKALWSILSVNGLAASFS
jgi:hypothetical protein